MKREIPFLKKPTLRPNTKIFEKVGETSTHWVNYHPTKGFRYESKGKSL